MILYFSLLYAGLEIYFEKQNRSAHFSYNFPCESLKENLEWLEVCMVSKKNPHILCVHLRCPMLPINSSTKAVLLISINRSEESTLQLAVKSYKDVPILAVNECCQQLWNALCQEERVRGRVFTQSQKKAGRSDQGTYHYFSLYAFSLLYR